MGGVVGGLTAIAILITGLLYFLGRKTRGGQDDYFEKPNPVYAVSDDCSCKFRLISLRGRRDLIELHQILSSRLILRLTLLNVQTLIT